MIVQNKIDKLLRDNLNVSKLIIKNESNKKIKDLEAKIQSAEKNNKINENKMQIEFSKKQKMIFCFLEGFK